MGRYEEHYWSTWVPFFPDDEEYGCEITDTETGLVGSTYKYRTSKEKAHDDAWDDLQSKLRDYYNSQPNSPNHESSSEQYYINDNNSDNSDSDYSYSKSDYESSGGNDYSGDSNYSGGGNYSSGGNYSGDNDLWGCIGGVVVIIIIVLVFVSLQKSCDHKRSASIEQNYQLRQQQQQEQFEREQQIEQAKQIDFEKKRRYLDGIWKKQLGWYDKGIIVSFENGQGIIIETPDNQDYYSKGFVYFKDYDPEFNYISHWLNLADDYTNDVVIYVDSNTFRLGLSGDEFKRVNNFSTSDSL